MKDCYVVLQNQKWDFPKFSPIRLDGNTIPIVLERIAKYLEAVKPDAWPINCVSRWKGESGEILILHVLVTPWEHGVNAIRLQTGLISPKKKTNTIVVSFISITALESDRKLIGLALKSCGLRPIELDSAR